jgi:hypothetical protein
MQISQHLTQENNKASHAEVKKRQPPLRNKTAQLTHNSISLINGRSEVGVT